MTNRTFVSSHTYQFGDLRNMVSCLMPAIGMLGIIIILAACANLLKFVVTTGIANALESADLNLLWAVPFGFLFALTLILVMPNRYPNIDVYEEGLEVQFLWVFCYFVPWEDVLKLRTEFVHLVRSYPPVRAKIVTIRKPTILHRLMGKSPDDSKLTIVILNTIDRYQELMRTIKEKTNLDEEY